MTDETAMEFIDGHSVIGCQVRFRQRVAIDDAEAPAVRDGDLIFWLVKARCLPPQYHPAGRDSEDRIRLNIQDVEDAAPLTESLRESAIVYLDHGQDQGYLATEEQTLPLDLAFEAPRYSTNGLIDPTEVTELRELLAGVGGSQPGERLADTVRRLLYDEVERVITSERQPTGAEAHQAAANDLRDRAAPVVDLLPTGDSEIVGSVYRGGRSELQDLLAEHFRSPEI